MSLNMYWEQKVKNIDKFNVGDYLGGQQGFINNKISTDYLQERIELINLGIGKVILVQNPEGKEIKAVLEDVDFSNKKNKRYIFTYYNFELNELSTIDTMFDKNWLILKVV